MSEVGKLGRSVWGEYERLVKHHLPEWAQFIWAYRVIYRPPANNNVRIKLLGRHLDCWKQLIG